MSALIDSLLGTSGQAVTFTLQHLSTDNAARVLQVVSVSGSDTHTVQIKLTPAVDGDGSVLVLVDGEAEIDTRLSFDWLEDDVGVDIDGRFCELDFGAFSLVISGADGIEIDMYDENGEQVDTGRNNTAFAQQLSRMLS